MIRTKSKKLSDYGFEINGSKIKHMTYNLIVSEFGHRCVLVDIDGNIILNEQYAEVFIDKLILVLRKYKIQEVY
jgi:hypothetical protein